MRLVRHRRREPPKPEPISFGGLSDFAAQWIFGDELPENAIPLSDSAASMVKAPARPGRPHRRSPAQTGHRRPRGSRCPGAASPRRGQTPRRSSGDTEHADPGQEAPVPRGHVEEVSRFRVASRPPGASTPPARVRGRPPSRLRRRLRRHRPSPPQPDTTPPPLELPAAADGERELRCRSRAERRLRRSSMRRDGPRPSRRLLGDPSRGWSSRHGESSGRPAPPRGRPAHRRPGCSGARAVAAKRGRGRQAAAGQAEVQAVQSDAQPRAPRPLRASRHAGGGGSPRAECERAEAGRPTAPAAQVVRPSDRPVRSEPPATPAAPDVGSRGAAERCHTDDTPPSGRPPLEGRPRLVTRLLGRAVNLPSVPRPGRHRARLPLRRPLSKRGRRRSEAGLPESSVGRRPPAASRDSSRTGGRAASARPGSRSPLPRPRRRRRARSPTGTGRPETARPPSGHERSAEADSAPSLPQAGSSEVTPGGPEPTTAGSPPSMAEPSVAPKQRRETARGRMYRRPCLRPRPRRASPHRPGRPRRGSPYAAPPPSPGAPGARPPSAGRPIGAGIRTRDGGAAVSGRRSSGSTGRPAPPAAARRPEGRSAQRPGAREIPRLGPRPPRLRQAARSRPRRAPLVEGPSGRSTVRLGPADVGAPTLARA